jgi:hypothetical protein
MKMMNSIGSGISSVEPSGCATTVLIIWLVEQLSIPKLAFVS